VDGDGKDGGFLPLKPIRVGRDCLWAGSGDHLLPKIRLKKPRLFPLSTSSNFDCKERVGAEQFSYHKGVRDGFSSGKYIGVSHILRTLRLGI
jgi:hypothetical protein